MKQVLLPWTSVGKSIMCGFRVTVNAIGSNFNLVHFHLVREQTWFFGKRVEVPNRMDEGTCTSSSHDFVAVH